MLATARTNPPGAGGTFTAKDVGVAVGASLLVDGDAVSVGTVGTPDGGASSSSVCAVTCLPKMTMKVKVSTDFKHQYFIDAFSRVRSNRDIGTS